MRATLVSSSAKALPLREQLSTDDGHIDATQGQSLTLAPNETRSQATESVASELPSTKQKFLLSELASAINQEHSLCREAYKASLLHARRTGELLLQAKLKVKKSTSGRWLFWLRENCPDISDRTARAYMEVAREWERIEKSATVADFGLKEALKFLSDSKGSKKSTVGGAKPPGVVDAEWSQAHSLQETLFDNTLALKERARVVVTQDHPLFAGQHGTITGQPSVDAAVVLLDEGERERILVTHLQPEEQLKPQSLGCEPEASQSLSTNESSAAMPFSNTGCNSATNLITQDENDAVASEIAIGIKHLTPEQLAWAISASAASGLSSAHLEAAIKACKQALSQRYRPDHFRK